MQMLVAHAIRDAAATGIARFSLASAPAQHSQTGKIMQYCAALFVRHSKTAGLRRFKSGFAPRWQPLYAAAPGPVRLMLALMDITQCIHHPPPIPNTSVAHKQDEDCEVALILAP